MEKIVLDVLTAGYASVGVIGKIGYWPTIKDLYWHKKPCANINTYGLWTMTTAVVLLYAALIIDNFWFRVVAALDFTFCLTILTLSLRLKYKTVKVDADRV